MSDNPAKGNQGKRYSVEDKTEIAEFIKAYNAEHKRGGMKAASDKYGVSVVTLSNWGKSTRKPKKKAKAKVVKPKTATEVKAIVEQTPTGPDAYLYRMLTIRAEIAKLEKEYENLKAKL